MNASHGNIVELKTTDYIVSYQRPEEGDRYVSNSQYNQPTRH